jgi:hypothetical protein
MFRRNITKNFIVFLFVYLFATTRALAGPTLQNGDFSSPLSVGWTDWSVTAIESGEAVLGEDPFAVAFLEQEFTIPGLAISLSFEYKPLFETDGAESFTVSLLDPISFDPLIPTDADTLDPSETFYFMHDWNYFHGIDDVLTDPMYVTQTDLGTGWTSVTLNLTSLGGTETDALLAFDFIPGFDDASFDGQIRVDKVSIAVIPAPSALLLGLVGLGSLRFLRGRYKQLFSMGC